ncbi:MAG: hypothetical protein PV344_03020 [Anaplasma sp.]|nr:hypothetical protein [Anaplasma sp.]
MSAIKKSWRTLKLRLHEWNAIALSDPVRIVFSFASHALESHNDLVLMTQHSSFPSCGLVSSVYGSQRKGHGFESRLKLFKIFCKANELLYKVESFETCGELLFALHVTF